MSSNLNDENDATPILSEYEKRRMHLLHCIFILADKAEHDGIKTLAQHALQANSNERSMI